MYSTILIINRNYTEVNESIVGVIDTCSLYYRVYRLG